MSLCHRFDYALHTSQSVEAAPCLELVRPPPERTSLSTGVVRPQRALRGFRMPTHSAVLGAYVISHGLLVAILGYGNIQLSRCFNTPLGRIALSDFLEYGCYDALVAVIALPIMCLAVILAAYIDAPGKSGLHLLWSYEECWRLTPSYDAVAEATKHMGFMQDTKAAVVMYNDTDASTTLPADVKIDMVSLREDIEEEVDKGYAYRACICGGDGQLT